MAINWHKLRGKTCILNHPPNNYYEVKVLNVSPSGKRVKLKFENGLIRWDAANELHLIERLA